LDPRLHDEYPPASQARALRAGIYELWDDNPKDEIEFEDDKGIWYNALNKSYGERR